MDGAAFEPAASAMRDELLPFISCFINQKISLKQSVSLNKIGEAVFQGCRMYCICIVIVFYRLPSGLPMIDDVKIVSNIIIMIIHNR